MGYSKDMKLIWSVSSQRCLNAVMFAREELAKALCINRREAHELYFVGYMETGRFTEKDLESAALILENWGCKPMYEFYKE